MEKIRGENFGRKVKDKEMNENEMEGEYRKEGKKRMYLKTNEKWICKTIKKNKLMKKLIWMENEICREIKEEWIGRGRKEEKTNES